MRITTAFRAGSPLDTTLIPPTCRATWPRTLRSAGRAGTPAKINFRPAELVAFEGQNFRVDALAAIRLLRLVGDDDFIAGLDEPDKFKHPALSRARPATFKVSGAVQVRVRWSGKGEIVRQVFLDEAAVTPGEGAVILFCEFDSAVHEGLPLIVIV